MRYLASSLLFALLSGDGASHPYPQSHTTYEEQLDRRIGYSTDTEVSAITLRQLLARDDFSVMVPRALRVHEWLRSTFPERLVEPEITDTGFQVWNHRRPLRDVVDKTELKAFRLCDVIYLAFSPRTLMPSSVQFRLNGDFSNATPLPRERVIELARQLAEVTGALLPGYEYIASIGQHPNADTLMVSYTACLPGTKIEVGPGVSGNMHKYTGVPTFMQFSQTVILHETPFRATLTREEGYMLAVAAAYDRVPWSAYRVFVSSPDLEVPDYGADSIVQTARHANLIREKRSCLVTNVSIRPVVEPGTIPPSIIVSIDSQTREILAIGEGIGPQHAGGAKAGVPLKNQLKPNQMIGLLDGSLKIPVVLAKGETKPESGSLKVVFRQGPISFAAELDANRHILWHEGKAYKSTRAFTAGLLKAFSR